MHTVALVLATTAVVGLLTAASLGVARVADALAPSAQEPAAVPAARMAATTGTWDGIERRTGVDRRWRADGGPGAGGERRRGGRRATDHPQVRVA
ncbi:hypothetical protein GKE82_22080 [Conexibacter sp. W3-3-2]|uniref:hypothetical protein n=1 Tax=Conexibacter sp. W3-3-2 TaxID=2675227 RepID=UPI0012B6B8FA|nr:hypothetical protein [Conexibacter sp. W3-3-2]MTD46904.1 hypothetical protein [Conexibacter sp. W3-3-2]